MRKLLAVSTAFVSILISVAWCVWVWATQRKLSWEAAIGFAAATAAFFALFKDKEISFIATPYLEHDKSLFDLFQTTLSPSDSIENIRHHDFGNAYLTQFFDDLVAFNAEWSQPTREFLITNLTQAFSELLTASKQFTSALAEKTYSVGDGTYGAVYSDSAREAGPRSQIVLQNARTLNYLADQLCEKHDGFVRLAKRELYK